MKDQFKSSQPCCTPKALNKHMSITSTSGSGKARQMNTNGKHK